MDETHCFKVDRLSCANDVNVTVSNVIVEKVVTSAFFFKDHCSPEWAATQERQNVTLFFYFLKL